MTNISYELAKKLKEVGFPQPQVDEYGWPNSKCEFYRPITLEGKQTFQIMSWLAFGLDSTAAAREEIREETKYWVAIPNLSKLIEWCGDKFNGLIRKGDDVFFAAGGRHTGFYGDEYLCQGKTPKEAVARLGIAIHKRGKQ